MNLIALAIRHHECLPVSGRENIANVLMFKQGLSIVSGQRTIFQGQSLFPPNDVAQRVIVVANHVIAVAYSHDCCCQHHLKKYVNLTGNSSHGRYRDPFAVVDVSLNQRPKLYCF